MSDLSSGPDGQGAAPQSPGASHPPPSPQPPRPPLPRRASGSGGERPTSFYVAIFLTLLLFVSAGLNVILLLVALFSSAAGSLTGSPVAGEDDAMYGVVAVAGDSGARKRILRVSIEGAIAEQASPLIGASGGTVSEVKRNLKLAARDSSIAGVLLDINSPGGGVTASDEIHRLISNFRKEHDKPVVALFGDMSASGGYYIAAACNEILARPTTITGSIGVIISTLNYAEAMKKLGISQDPIVDERTPYKDMLSPAKRPDPAESEIVRSIVREMYDRFVDIVADGRGIPRDTVVSLADGRIYSAKQARDNGLVDDIVDFDGAVARVEKLAEIDTSRIVEYRRRPTFAEVLMGASSRTQPANLSLADALAPLLRNTTGPRFLYFWPGGR